MVTFYVDGSCTNDGSENAAGGHGVVGVVNNTGRYFFYAGDPNTTNNREELKAIVHVLFKFGWNPETWEMFKKAEEYPIVYSDSAYAINTLTNWMFKWAENDWTKSDGKTPENLDLIKIYYTLWKQGWRIDLRKVKAHAGNYWNELADTLAKRAREK